MPRYQLLKLKRNGKEIAVAGDVGEAEAAQQIVGGTVFGKESAGCRTEEGKAEAEEEEGKAGKEKIAGRPCEECHR